LTLFYTSGALISPFLSVIGSYDLKPFFQQLP
jgi:hypothetical protein